MDPVSSTVEAIRTSSICVYEGLVSRYLVNRRNLVVSYCTENAVPALV